MPRWIPGRRTSKKEAFVSPVAHAEAFRILRSNLDVALAELSHPTILVTSASPGEGKTATAVNLTRALTLAGRRTVLVDFDLRHPDTHNHLGADNLVGVSDVLNGDRSLSECLQFIKVDTERQGSDGTKGFYFLPTGPSVSNPTELLDGRRTSVLLAALAEQADLVLVDTPPLLPVADTLVIGRRVSGAILVVETRRTPIAAIQHAKNALLQNQTRLVGIVVNKLQPRDGRSEDGYGYGYGYGYGPLETEVPSSNRAAPGHRSLPNT
jgi:capsular exopolysaccharide synthesis family protein